MLKSVSRRRRLAGDSDATPTAEVAAVLVVVAEGAERAAEEGVGEVAPAAGAVGVFAGSRRQTSVRRSPVESTDGGLFDEPFSGKHCPGSGTLTLTTQLTVVMYVGIPASEENTRGLRACQ